MKKTLISILIFAVILGVLCNVSFATEETSLVLGWRSEISEDKKTVTVTLSIDSLTGLPETVSIMGYQANLNYEDNIFDSVEIKNVDSWQNTYLDSTGNVIGECTNKENFKSNQDVAVFKFTLKEGIETIDTDIKLTDLGVSFDGEAPINFDTLTVNAKITKGTDENKQDETNTQDDKKDEESKEKENTTASNKSKAEDITKKAEEAQKKAQTTVKENGDKTTIGTILPKTGKYASVSIIALITIISVVFLIKYKKIQIK